MSATAPIPAARLVLRGETAADLMSRESKSESE